MCRALGVSSCWQLLGTPRACSGKLLGCWLPPALRAAQGERDQSLIVSLPGEPFEAAAGGPGGEGWVLRSPGCWQVSFERRGGPSHRLCLERVLELAPPGWTLQCAEFCSCIQPSGNVL